MARKTFISYKYSEAQELRDKIIKALGEDASYYNGETSDSPDLTDTSTENIKKKLSDMIWGTSVTIVIVSPNMEKSNWIEWEIQYSLKEITRQDATSHSNGIVGVIIKDKGGHDWLINKKEHNDGCKSISFKNEYLPKIIIKNMFNQEPKQYSCKYCQTVDGSSGNYISLIKEDVFLENPQKYIENAYKKSRNSNQYKLVKETK